MTITSRRLHLRACLRGLGQSTIRVTRRRMQGIARGRLDPRAHLAVFRQRLASGLSWNVLAALSLQGAVLLSSIVVARILGLSSFGAYSVLVTTVMTVAAVAQGGSGLVASKFVGENLAGDTLRVARVLRMCRNFALASGAVASLLLIAAAELLCRDVFHRPELASPMRLIALASFFHVSVSYQFGALQGFGAFRQLSRGSVISGLAHLGFTAIGAWLEGLIGALVGFLAASALRFVVFALLLRAVRHEHGIPSCKEAQQDEWQMVAQFALPAGLAGLVSMPCLLLVTALVARLPDGLAAVALFSAAHQMRLAVLQVPTLLNSVSFSLLSRLKGKNEAAEYREVFWSGLWINTAFATGVVVILAAAASDMLRLYGQDFTAGRWVLIMLLVSVIPESIAMSTYQLVQSAGRMWTSLLLIAAPRDLAHLAIAAAFVPTHGVMGAAGAYLAAQFIGLSSTVVTALRHAQSLWAHSIR